MSKRTKLSLPGFLKDVAYGENSMQEEYTRFHQSLILRKKNVQELLDYYDSSDIMFSASHDDKEGLIMELNTPMTPEDAEWQNERMQSQATPKIPSMETCIAKMHHAVWATVLVNMARYLDLEKRAPEIEVLSTGQCVAVGECKYLHASQLILLNKDKQVSDYRFFYRNRAVCIMVDVKLK